MTLQPPISTTEEIDSYVKLLGMTREETEILLDFTREILDTLRGVKDIKNRLAPILEPSGIAVKTTAILTPIQTQAIGNMGILADLFPFFKPLKGCANEICLVSKSKDGIGQEAGIRLMGAYSGLSGLKQLMLTMTPGETKVKESAKK